jgi:hypothetical protein
MRSALWAGLLRIHWRALRPSKPPSNKKERLYEAVSELTLAFSGRALAPLPHPPRASTKTKTWLEMVGSVQPLCLSVELCRIEQKGPRTNTEQCRLPPSVQNASMVILPPPTGYESGVLSGRYFCAAPGGTSSRVISRHFDQAISAQHIEKVKLGCTPKPAEFIRQRFCYCVTGWLWQGRQRSGRRRTGRIGRLRAITESAG